MEGSKEMAMRIKELEFMELFGDMAEDVEADFQTHNYIESLLANSAIPEQREREIYHTLQRGGFTNLEAMEVIEYLKRNQLCRIDSGFRYSATDIKYKLKNGKDT